MNNEPEKNSRELDPEELGSIVGGIDIDAIHNSKYLGVKCPYCDYWIPRGIGFSMLQHIAEKHPKAKDE